MDASRIEQLALAKRITARQRSELLRLVQAGVTDPCVAREAPGLCRLWYKHAPQCQQLQGAVADVRTIVLGQPKAHVHYAIAADLSAHAKCEALGTFLAAWLAVTRDCALLEGVAWSWLDLVADDARRGDDDERVLPWSVDDCAAAPQKLLRTMSLFRAHFKLRHMRIDTLVDDLALRLGWWTTDSELRRDTFLLFRIDAALAEHEWVPRAELCVSEDDACLARLVAANEVALVPDGITKPFLLAASRAVKAVVPRFDEDKENGIAWSADAPPAELNEEQRALWTRIVRDARRLTLCCAPAGTGKTHTATAIAACAPGPVVCLAPTWKAISVLRSKLWPMHGSCSFMTVQAFVHTETPPLASFVLVDEASMLTMPHLRRILYGYVGDPACRLLFLGDDAQLPCIGRGFPIRDLQTVLPPLRLRTCVRTSGAGLLAAAHAVREGAATFPEAPDEVRVEPAHKVIEYLMQTTQFAAVPPWHADYVQIISPQNNHVDDLNRAVQAALTSTAPLFSSCHVGDAVRLHENTETYKNGDEGVFIALEEAPATSRGAKRAKRGDARVAVVELRDGRQVRVHDKHMAPAYATTVHKVQGSEYGTVILALFFGTHPDLKTREMVYTSVTRAQRMLRVVGATGVLQTCEPLVRRTVFAHA